MLKFRSTKSYFFLRLNNYSVFVKCFPFISIFVNAIMKVDYW